MADLFADALMLAIKIFAASLFTAVLCGIIVITAWVVVGFRNLARLEKEVKEAHKGNCAKREADNDDD